ncbi:MAG: T9SS type A sorting domain-containing protein [Flavisolibacter sp.]
MRKLYVSPGSMLAVLFCCFFLPLFSPSLQKFHIREVKRITGEIAEYNVPGGILQQEIDQTKDPATGTVPLGRLEQARAEQLRRFALQKSARMEAAVPGINWTERGPDNVGGRTRAILFDNRFGPDYKKVWAGGVGGGLWTTNDITATPVAWTKVNDALDNLAITCISQHPFTDSGAIMYAGTGEGWYNGDSIRGNGIYKTIDGGNTWTLLPSTRDNPNFYSVQDIKVICCGVGPAVVATTRRGGIQRSTDGGATWTKVLGAGVGGGGTNEGADLEFIYNYIFATMGIHTGGGGIYRSSDGGKTWDAIYNATGSEGRIEIACNPNAYWQMYALVTQNFGAGDSVAIEKIIRNDVADDVPSNVITSWVTKANPPRCSLGNTTTDFLGGQGDYDVIAAIDPTVSNSNTLFVGGIDLYRSDDGGAHWTQLSSWANGYCGVPYVHADIHEILFRPNYTFPGPAQDLLISCDGGIFRTANRGSSFTDRNKSYNVTQFYSCAIHPSSTNYFLAGAQDNGTLKFNSSGMNSTTEASGGDGGFCFIDQDDASRQITSYVMNNYFFSSDGGGSFTDYFWSTNGSFINPSDYDNANDILYAGAPAGDYFRWTNVPTGSPSTVSVSDFSFARITHVRISPHTANRVYFGLDNGSVVRVDGADGSSITTKIIRSATPGQSVSCIAIDPSDEGHMLVSYFNYGVVSVYESKNATAATPTWQSVEGNLPDMPVRWAMFDPRSSKWAILATEKGIWSTDNLGAAAVDWQPTNNNFANTRVDMLRYRASDRLLLAATHGRGLFSTTVPASAPLPVSLVDFSGSLQSNDVWLQWTTAWEQNSRNFELERSADGQSFKKIGTVSAAQNSNTNKVYSFHDRDIAQENNYYRLKQVDGGGQFNYSKIILIKNPLKGQQLFSILNNPVDNTIDLQFGTELKGNIELSLLDARGMLVFQQLVQVGQDRRFRVHLDNLQLSSGVYVLTIEGAGKKLATKLIKQ